MNKMSSMDRLVIRAVVETTVDQLAIVGGTMANAAQLQPLPPSAAAAASTEYQQQVFLHPNVTDMSLEDLLVREKKVLQRKSHKANNNDSRSMALKRLTAETNYIQLVLEDTLEEVDEFGTFSALRDSVARSEERQQEKIKISETEKSIRYEINDLKASILDAKEKSKADILSESLLIARLKDGLLEATRVTKGEEEFTRDLETVRENERVKLLESEERGLAEKRDNLKRDIEHEQRVTLELESWLNDRRSHLRTQHKLWTERLKSDLTQRELDLQELTQARESDLRCRADATKALIHATTFVRDEIGRRERLRKAKERMQLEIKTAIKIQAWWRMIMVRRNLGPFRKRRPKPVKQQKRMF